MASILQEFLIELGVHVDHSKLKGQLGDTHKQVKEFVEKANEFLLSMTGVSVVSMAAIGEAVAHAAEVYERLYFVSQRTGQAIPALRAFEFASRQVGVSMETAEGAAEAFAATLRTNPFFAAAFGIPTDKGPVGMVGALQRSGMPYFMQAQIAAMGGMDERTFKMYRDNAQELERQQNKYLQLQKKMGLDTAEVGKRFTDFEHKVNDLKTEFALASEALGLKFLPIANKLVGWANEAIDAFSKLDLKPAFDTILNFMERAKKGFPKVEAPPPAGAGVESWVQTIFGPKGTFLRDTLGSAFQDFVAQRFSGAAKAGRFVYTGAGMLLGSGTGAGQMDLMQRWGVMPGGGFGGGLPSTAIPGWGGGGVGFPMPGMGKQSSLTNDVEVNIYLPAGMQNPHAVASAVGDEVKRVYADLTRYGQQVLLA